MNDIYFATVAPLKRAKLFRNGDSQAVRLPKEFRFEGSEVLIRKLGAGVVLLPVTQSWDTLVASLSKFPDDFMQSRDQPQAPDHREDIA